MTKGEARFQWILMINQASVCARKCAAKGDAVGARVAREEVDYYKEQLRVLRAEQQG